MRKSRMSGNTADTSTNYAFRVNTANKTWINRKVSTVSSQVNKLGTETGHKVFKSNILEKALIAGLKTLDIEDYLA